MEKDNVIVKVEDYIGSLCSSANDFLFDMENLLHAYCIFLIFKIKIIPTSRN